MCRRTDHALIGIDFESVGRTGSEDVKAIELLRSVEDLLIEDCRFARFGTNLVFMDLDKTGPFADIRLRRCQVLDSFLTTSHSQGLYTQGLSRFSAFECLFAHNGYGSPTADTGATQFNRLRKESSTHQIEVVGAELRSMMPFVGGGKKA